MHRNSFHSLAADDAFDIKAKPPDSQVVLADAIFLQGVELFSSVDNQRQSGIENTKTNGKREERKQPLDEASQEEGIGKQSPVRNTTLCYSETRLCVF